MGAVRKGDWQDAALHAQGMLCMLQFERSCSSHYGSQVQLAVNNCTRPQDSPQEQVPLRPGSTAIPTNHKAWHAEARLKSRPAREQLDPGQCCHKQLPKLSAHKAARSALYPRRHTCSPMYSTLVLAGKWLIPLSPAPSSRMPSRSNSVYSTLVTLKLCSWPCRHSSVSQAVGDQASIQLMAFVCRVDITGTRGHGQLCGQLLHHLQKPLFTFDPSELRFPVCHCRTPEAPMQGRKCPERC